MFKTGWLVLAAFWLTACGAHKPQSDLRHGVETGVTAGQSADPAPGPGVYRIDTSRSSLRLLVYRAGAMARLGHNHVISHGAIDGWVRYSGNPTVASLLLRVPVNEFVVDDAALRGEEGADFAAAVPEDARGGTRHNLLSEALLDAAQHPVITLRSIAVSQDHSTRAPGGTVTVTLAVDVAGHASTLEVPFVLIDEGRVLRASGSVQLRQSELGLVPFSVMLGALQVQDEFTVEFDLLAGAT